MFCYGGYSQILLKTHLEASTRSCLPVLSRKETKTEASKDGHEEILGLENLPYYHGFSAFDLCFMQQSESDQELKLPNDILTVAEHPNRYLIRLADKSTLSGQSLIPCPRMPDRERVFFVRMSLVELIAECCPAER